ncbi:MAG: hypothetical protein AB7F89_09585 [Pirellulaceae bacterium]
MITFKQQFQFTAAKNGRRRIVKDTPPRPAPAMRVPRISRLVALAIRYDSLLRTGHVPNLSTLARLSHVTQPRMTQILALNLLAPDIQEELLHLPPAEVGKDPIHEKLLRPLAAETDWQRQRQMWRELKSPATGRQNAR